MFKMKNSCFVWYTILFSIVGCHVHASTCGCKALSTCYENMLDALHDQDEAYCVEDATIGTSTLSVYMKALQEFCGEVVSVNQQPGYSYDMRHLHEIVIEGDRNAKRTDESTIPIIVIDAGQEASTESVGFALYIIEQLVACHENEDMIHNVKWVIMPSTNPDGMEYAKYRKNNWKKNLRVADDKVNFGVDISRNFDDHWGSCGKVESGFSPVYPGPNAASENETIFIKDILAKHKRDTKIYLSIRGDGHHIGYPYAYGSGAPANLDQLKKIAAEISSKVNMRSGGVHTFANSSIFNLGGKAHCGHSVDYAHSLNIPLTFEMRVFLGSDNEIMSMFHKLPLGYQNTLRNGYFSGIREFYNVLTNEKKYGKI